MYSVVKLLSHRATIIAKLDRFVAPLMFVLFVAQFLIHFTTKRRVQEQDREKNPLNPLKRSNIPKETCTTFINVDIYFCSILTFSVIGIKNEESFCDLLIFLGMSKFVHHRANVSCSPSRAIGMFLQTPLVSVCFSANGPLFLLDRILKFAHFSSIQTNILQLILSSRWISSKRKGEFIAQTYK